MRLPVHTPKTLKDEEAQAAFRAHDADAAVVVAYGLILPKSDSRCTAARLLQYPCVAVAALARRRADQSRHHGGRCRIRRHHHEDGRGTRYRRHGHGGACADRRRHDSGRSARCPVAPGRRSDAARARLRRARLAHAHAAAGQGRHLCRQDFARTRPASTGRSPGSRCTITSAGCRRFPARGSRSMARAIKVLRSTKGEGTGAPGTVLDDKLTIACGDGAVRLSNCSAPASSR